MLGSRIQRMSENTSNEAEEGSPNFLNKAEKLFEALQKRDAEEDPLSSSPDLDIVNQQGPARLLQRGPQLLGFLASSPDLDIVNQRGPARFLQRGPQLLEPISESSEEDTLESEDSVNSRASGNSRSEADRSRGNIGRRTFDRSMHILKILMKFLRVSKTKHKKGRHLH